MGLGWAGLGWGGGQARAGLQAAWLYPGRLLLHEVVLCQHHWWPPRAVLHPAGCSASGSRCTTTSAGALQQWHADQSPAWSPVHTGHQFCQTGGAATIQAGIRTVLTEW